MHSRILIAVAILLLLGLAFGLVFLFHAPEDAATDGGETPGAAPTATPADGLDPTGSTEGTAPAAGDPRELAGAANSPQRGPRQAPSTRRSSPDRAPRTKQPPPPPPPPRDYEMKPPRELSEAAQALVGKSWQEGNDLVVLGENGSLQVGNDDTGSWDVEGDQVVLHGPLEKVLPLEEVAGK